MNPPVAHPLKQSRDSENGGVADRCFCLAGYIWFYRRDHRGGVPLSAPPLLIARIAPGAHTALVVEI